ncbi:ZW10 interactor [Grus japonensis]|uniref:ZW10 interactor n=1 Tax=Grus japonensis TaxID=30415 RepID=A0ABC9XX72_GRUJA
MAAAGRLERARGALEALEAALALEEEEGEVPARVLVEHLVDTRRKQKLLLTQLRVLRLLLGVIENPGPPQTPPDPREAGRRARSRWRGLKSGYGGAVEALGGSLPPALTQLGKGRNLLRRWKGVLGRRLRQEELEAKVREATERREQLRRRVEQRRREHLSQQGALQRQRGGAQRPCSPTPPPQ